MIREWEARYPWAAGLVFAVVYWVFFKSIPLPKTTGDLLGAVVGIAGIAVGFLAAAQSILLSIDDNRIVKELRENGRYDSIIDKIDSAMMWSFLLAILSVIGLCADFESFQWPSAVVTAWMFTSAAAAASCFRVIRIFKKILRSPK